MVDKQMVSTTFDLPGYKVVKTLGVARGIIVRSRSIVGTIGGGLQSLLGGDITLFTELCEKAREDSFKRMLKNASDLGANAIIGVRYDAADLGGAITEVLVYGTAVVVERQ